MDAFLIADTWIALATLCFLEIILGVDNVIFISILSNKLPEEQQARVRTIGLALAASTRILFLLSISWIIGFTEPLFTLPQTWLNRNPITFNARDLILGLGGLFLIGKSTKEINRKMDLPEYEGLAPRARQSMLSVIGQIALLDIIFSFDSILTAIGMVDQIMIMIVAIVVSIIVMMLFSGYIGRYIREHPSIEMIALSFLILIGFTLTLEALHQGVPKGYIYFAISFSVFTEMINIRARNKRQRALPKEQ